MLIEESDDDFDSLENVGENDNVRSAISIPVGQAKAQATPNPHYPGTRVISISDNNGEGASRVSITPAPDEWRRREPRRWPWKDQARNRY